MKHIQTFESFLNEAANLAVNTMYCVKDKNVILPLRKVASMTTLEKGDKVKITKANADGKSGQYLATVVSAKNANVGDTVLISDMSAFEEC